MQHHTVKSKKTKSHSTILEIGLCLFIYISFYILALCLGAFIDLNLDMQQTFVHYYPVFAVSLACFGCVCTATRRAKISTAYVAIACLTIGIGLPSVASLVIYHSCVSKKWAVQCLATMLATLLGYWVGTHIKYKRKRIKRS